MKKNDNCLYVIFGASGDLNKRKLVPSLYALFVQGLLPEKFAVLGVSRTPFTDEAHRAAMKADINKYKEVEDGSQIDAFLQKIYYVAVQVNDEAAYPAFKQQVEDLRIKEDIGGNTVFYLSTPPTSYGIIPKHLASVGLNKQKDGWKRLIIEKPFGYDLQSAQKLKKILLKDWNEDQLFRIDHYLGKETVQNLLVTRFSNGIFEPLWNRNYIHRVEITAAESLGVEQRGGYYETAGALRDMVQNHLLQVAAIAAMEPPSSLEPIAIRNEVLKVFQSLRPIQKADVKTHAIRGQYVASTIKGEKIAGVSGRRRGQPHFGYRNVRGVKILH